MILLIGKRDHPTISALHDFIVTYKEVHTLLLEPKLLINNLIVSDNVESNLTSIFWQIHDTEIRSSICSGVLNLLDHLPRDIFTDFVEEDRSYAQLEFTAYLIFALSHFHNIINPPTNGGLSGFCDSLPFQWLLCRKYSESVVTPDFYFGLFDDAPDHLRNDVNTVVSDNIFRGTYWKTNRTQESLQNDYYLFYKRPRGVPLLVTKLDQQEWVTQLDDRKIAINNNRLPLELCNKLMNDYSLRLAEILFFYDEKHDRFCFGCIIPGAYINRMEPTLRADFLNVLFNKLVAKHP
jgi:hypothetical protein